MEKEKIFYLQIVAVIFSLIVGTLLHFTYEWSGKNQVVGVFSAVNESVWEHLKLAFFPILFFTLIEGCLVGYRISNYVEAKAVAMVFGMAFITIFFYTYTGILGKNLFVLDILSFILAILFSETLAYRIMLMGEFSNMLTRGIAIAVIGAITIFFIVATYNPPNLNYFKPPKR